MLLNPLNGNSLTQRFSFLLDSKARYLYNECLPPPLPSHKKKKGSEERQKENKRNVWSPFLKNNSFKINCYFLRSRINAHS